MRNKRVDRSYLNEVCAKKYGISQKEYYRSLFRENKNEANIPSNLTYRL